MSSSLRLRPCASSPKRSLESLARDLNRFGVLVIKPDGRPNGLDGGATSRYESRVITSHLSEWIRHLEETVGVEPSEVEGAFRKAILDVAAPLYAGDGYEVVVDIGPTGLHLGLRCRVTTDPSGPGVSVDALSATDELDVSKAPGETIVLAIYYSYFGAKTVHEKAERVSEQLQLPHNLFAPEIGFEIVGRLEEIVWSYRGKGFVPQPGTLGHLLAGGSLCGEAVEVDGVRVELVGCEWVEQLNSPTTSAFLVEYTLRISRGGEPVELCVPGRAGWKNDDWRRFADLPAAVDRERFRDALRQIASDLDAIERLEAESQPLSDFVVNRECEGWCDMLTEPLVAAATDDSLFSWLQTRLSEDRRLVGPSRSPRKFGMATATFPSRRIGWPLRVTVPLGRLSPDALELPAPHEELQQWLDVQLGRLWPYAEAALLAEGNEPPASHAPAWPLLDVVEMCVRSSELPQSTPPLPDWDEFSIKRFAKRLEVTPPHRRNGLETAEAMSAVGSLPSLYPVRIASFEIDGWRLELVGTTEYAWRFTTILLAPPETDDWVPVLWSDRLACIVRWCPDGDLFAFQAFIDLLRAGIAEAGLDGPADAQAMAFLLLAECTREVFPREVNDAPIRLTPGGFDPPDEDVLADRIASDPTWELWWNGMGVTEWLLFDEPPRDERWVLDWRVNFPSVVTATPMGEAVPRSYALSPRLDRQFREECPRIWRRFLSEVDPRFAEYVGL